jgi:hypothetical protein
MHSSKTSKCIAVYTTLSYGLLDRWEIYGKVYINRTTGSYSNRPISPS